MSTRILIADDEPSVLHLLELVLSNEGFQVMMAHNGDQLVRMAQASVPDLLIIDLMMPAMDGYEAIRQLRNDTRTAHLPMLILTAKSTPDDVVTGFETGADDYITKPFNIPELLARIRGHLRRASAQPVRSPLTGLPGNILLTEEMKYRMRGEKPFALLYIDLDNFKAFNDTYGPSRGDRVIQLVAEVLHGVVHDMGSASDFIGHIGGDDFALLTTPANIEPFAREMIARFDRRVRDLYDPIDLERGYLQGVDRQGVPRRFPIIAMSIGVASNDHRHFADHEAMSRVAAEMKGFAKQQPGSSYAVDSRSDGEQVVDERRGEPHPAVLVAVPDDQVRSAISRHLTRHGFRTLEASNSMEAHALLAQDLDVKVTVLDQVLEDTAIDLLQALLVTQPEIGIIAVAAPQTSGVNGHAVLSTADLAGITARVVELLGQPPQAGE